MGGRSRIPLAARLANDQEWSLPAADYSAIGPAGKRFSWLNPLTLWRSRNNVLASFSGDPTENARRAWVAAQRARLAADGEPSEITEDFTIERADLGEFSFMLMGDTGEGDESQFAAVPGFLAAAKQTEFAMIASDVVYPAGDVNQYVERFFMPFSGYPRPIYAVPGNHDWLDGLAGFMRHFCAATPPRQMFSPPRRARYAKTALLLHHLFWRRAARVKPETIERAQELRGEAAASGPAQPNMYFSIDTPNLRIVAIDVGILGRIDHQQGEWLKRVSAGDKPKLLVSGKPFLAGPKFSPRRILPEAGDRGSSGTVWSVVTDPKNNYVATLAGDLHHYQRHGVCLPSGRSLQCLISGGGGAFMSSTHQIEPIGQSTSGEAEWVVFPTRGDSLRAYSIEFLRRIRKLTFWKSSEPVQGIPADEATAIVAKRHKLDLASELARAERDEPTGTIPQPSRRSRLLASLIYPRRAWFDPGHISEVLDWDRPPFFKNFVRADVSAGRLTLTAFAVSGLARDQNDPPVVDRVEIDLERAN